MNFLRTATMVLAGLAVTVGLVGVSSPANARDTSWDCPGCLIAGQR